MYKIFWSSLFGLTWLLILFINISFTFDLVQVVNPSALHLQNGDSYSNYYFGMSSFLDAFKTFFQNQNGLLANYSNFLQRMGRGISYLFSLNGINLNAINVGSNIQVDGIFTAVLYIAMLLVSGAPLLGLLVYGLLYIIYLVVFGFEIFLFLLSFLAGAFRTPLPTEFPPEVFNAMAIGF